MSEFRVGYARNSEIPSRIKPESKVRVRYIVVTAEDRNAAAKIAQKVEGRHIFTVVKHTKRPFDLNKKRVVTWGSISGWSEEDYGELVTDYPEVALDAEPQDSPEPAGDLDIGIGAEYNEVPFAFPEVPYTDVSASFTGLSGNYVMPEVPVIEPEEGDTFPTIFAVILVLLGIAAVAGVFYLKAHYN